MTTRGELAAEKAEHHVLILLRAYWLYVFLSAFGGYLIGYAASAKTVVDGSGIFTSTSTTHSVGAALASAVGALLFAVLSGLPLYGLAWLLEGQAILLRRSESDERIEPQKPESTTNDGTM